MLTTLVVQGLTLRWLIERVNLRDDGLVEREIGIARAETARAALRALESDDSRPAVTLRREYETRLRAAEDRPKGDEAEHSSAITDIQLRVVAEQRKTLLDLRERDVIGDAAFQAVEAELDLVEISADSRVRP